MLSDIQKEQEQRQLELQIEQKRQAELQVQIEQQRKFELEQQRLFEIEQHQLLEQQRQLEIEQQILLEQQQLLEQQRQLEIEQQILLEQQQLLEQQRLAEIELEKQKQLEVERQQELELEQARLQKQSVEEEQEIQSQESERLQQKQQTLSQSALSQLNLAGYEARPVKFLGYNKRVAKTSDNPYGLDYDYLNKLMAEHSLNSIGESYSDPSQIQDEVIDIDYGAIDAFTKMLNEQLDAAASSDLPSDKLKFKSNTIKSNYSSFVDEQLLLGKLFFL